MNDIKNENQPEKETNPHDARAAKGWKFMALGSFIGFLAGTFLKVVTVLVMAFFFIREVV